MKSLHSRLAHLTLVIATVALFGCGTSTSHRRSIVAQIRNEHIAWDGNYYGLQVRALGEAEQRVLAAGPSCRPFLIEALGDESRYVAAHVLLTKMEAHSYPLSAAEWNHLRVELLADGRVEIPAGQQQNLQALWAQK
jgi:hypothetical protein